MAEPEPKKPRTQDPIRAAAGRLAEARKAWQRLVARADRLDAEAKATREKIPAALQAVAQAEDTLNSAAKLT